MVYTDLQNNFQQTQTNFSNHPAVTGTVHVPLELFLQAFSNHSDAQVFEESRLLTWSKYTMSKIIIILL